MITLRLDEKLEQQITTAAENLGVTKSELIRKSINEYLRNFKQPSAWDLGENVFGKYSSGRGNLSSDRKELMRNKIKAKIT
jgi:predicted DNA-binding protein